AYVECRQKKHGALFGVLQQPTTCPPRTCLSIKRKRYVEELMYLGVIAKYFCTRADHSVDLWSGGIGTSHSDLSLVAVESGFSTVPSRLLSMLVSFGFPFCECLSTGCLLTQLLITE